MATETEETETSSLGDEWQWISNDTAEVLRATVENAFIVDPRKKLERGGASALDPRRCAGER